jgi:hypothetical protein
MPASPRGKNRDRKAEAATGGEQAVGAEVADEQVPVPEEQADDDQTSDEQAPDEDAQLVDAARPNRRERRAAGKQPQSIGKAPVRGQYQSTPHRRDYAARRRG